MRNTALRARTWLVACALGVSVPLGADESADAVIVARGEHDVTLGELDARMTRFPPHERAQFARQPVNLARLLDRLLVDSILASEARELGLDKDPLIRRDLELAIEEVLATHRMNRFFDEESLPDFRILARERYLADPSAYEQPEIAVVEHVLIGMDGRDEAAALALAETVREKAMQAPDTFVALVDQYSDDPSKSDNKGRFEIDDPERYAPEFVAGIKGLEKAGDVSSPVKTQFGYHVIRLIERTPARRKSYEEVEEAVVAKVERDYRDNVRVDYLAATRSRHPETGDEALLRTLPERYGGRPDDAMAAPGLDRADAGGAEAGR